jgi:hypothetical protein
MLNKYPQETAFKDNKNNKITTKIEEQSGREVVVTWILWGVL